MRPLGCGGSRRKLAIQAGLLVGVGAAIVGSEDRPAHACDVCPDENECSIEKVNLMIVLDYSSSMNEEYGNGQTRWQAAIAAIGGLVGAHNGYYDDNFHFALLRYGHDPNPLEDGTQGIGGFIDGVALDVEWYDGEAGFESPYHECNGQAIVDFLDFVLPPLCNGNPCSGIGTWTAGGLLLAQQTIVQSQADHPADLGNDPRLYANLVITDGVWTETDGLGMDPADNPAIVAADIYMSQGAPTYVVSFGDAMGAAFADELAIAGNTGAAFQAADAQGLHDAVQMVAQDIVDENFVPACSAGLPRIMILLDASSSMLNTGAAVVVPGTTWWDHARAAIAAGNAALFDAPVAAANGRALEDVAHVGLATFGHTGEEEVLVQYGPCMQDNLTWALDPSTSCAMPGCTDPWGGPPIDWTFVDGSVVDPPGFDAQTLSHMPDCQLGGNPDQCTGSGTYLHLGLDLIQQNQIAYAAAPPYPADDSTKYINIVITDGNFTGYSTDAQVSGELMEMYDAGIVTYVIGVGAVIDPLTIDDMACWGSGGAGIPCMDGTVAGVLVVSQAGLETALATIVENLNYDPCCAFNDCALVPEPTTGEPDPLPTITTGPTDSGDDAACPESSGSESASTSGVADDSGSSDGGPITSASTSSDETGPSTADGSTSVSTSSDSVDPSFTATSAGTTATTANDTEATGTGDSSQDSVGVTDRGCSCRGGATPGGLALLGLLGLFRRRRHCVARSASQRSISVRL